MTKCKFEYKLLIKTKKSEGDASFSTELENALSNKNPESFWKCWRSKFGAASKSTVISGSCNPAIIASKFASSFNSAYNTNSQLKHDVFKSSF